MKRSNHLDRYLAMTLWEAQCHAQIGGLTLAMAVSLFLVPVFVLDLRIVRWVPRNSWMLAARRRRRFDDGKRLVRSRNQLIQPND